MMLSGVVPRRLCCLFLIVTVTDPTNGWEYSERSNICQSANLFCVSIDRCRHMYKTTQDILMNRPRICGFRGHIPNICCPPKPEPIGSSAGVSTGNPAVPTTDGPRAPGSTAASRLPDTIGFTQGSHATSRPLPPTIPPRPQLPSPRPTPSGHPNRPPLPPLPPSRPTASSHPNRPPLPPLPPSRPTAPSHPNRPPLPPLPPSRPTAPSHPNRPPLPPLPPSRPTASIHPNRAPLPPLPPSRPTTSSHPNRSPLPPLPPSRPTASSHPNRSPLPPLPPSRPTAPSHPNRPPLPPLPPSRPTASSHPNRPPLPPLPPSRPTESSHPNRPPLPPLPPSRPTASSHPNRPPLPPLPPSRPTASSHPNRAPLPPLPPSRPTAPGSPHRPPLPPLPPSAGLPSRPPFPSSRPPAPGRPHRPPFPPLPGEKGSSSHHHPAFPSIPPKPTSDPMQCGNPYRILSLRPVFQPPSPGRVAGPPGPPGPRFKRTLPYTSPSDCELSSPDGERSGPCQPRAPQLARELSINGNWSRAQPPEGPPIDDTWRRMKRFSPRCLQGPPTPSGFPSSSCVLQVDPDVMRPPGIGGRDAVLWKWPWMALFGRWKDGTLTDWFCGGTLISPWYVLTAAHCLRSEPVNVGLRLGDHDLSTRLDVDHQERNISVVRVHGEYRGSQNDIALVRLDREARLTDAVRPICLPPAGSELTTGHPVEMAGWGTLSYQGSVPNILQEVPLKTVDTADCEAAYKLVPSYLRKFPGGFGDTKLCAGSIDDEPRDACRGDSGGPLMTASSEGVYEVIGIVSTGVGCGNPDFPGVYTKVSAYIDWINENMR